MLGLLFFAGLQLQFRAVPGVSGQAIGTQHVFHHINVSRNVQRVILKQAVQLGFKGGHKGIHHLFNALFGLADVLPLHALGIQLGIRFEQLQGRGQIVIHELAHLPGSAWPGQKFWR